MSIDKVSTVILLLFSIWMLSTCFQPAQAAEISLVTLDRSWHYSGDFNEEHGGLGLQVTVGDEVYGVVSYTNSFYEDSVLFTVNADTTHGLVLGLVTGYIVPLLPVIGYQFTFLKYFKITFTPVVAYTQFVIPIINW